MLAQVSIPWTDVDKTGSSLADLATRSASDLNSGTLDSALLDADLASIAANTTGGFLTRTAANTYTARTITGTAGQITVTNGDGVSGAPTISLPSTITQATTFSQALTTNGNLTFGTSGSILNGTTGSIGLTATGTNQSITLTPSGTGIAQVSFNPGANPTGIGVNGLHVVGADSGGFSTVALDAFGSVPFFVGRRANGTAASPTAVQGGDFLFQFSARGYGTSYTGTRAYIAAQATENWSGSANGTRITFLTTPNGSTSGNTPLSIEEDQSIRLPSTNTAGLQLYNTADQTTNYERLEALWSGNNAVIRTVKGGSGSNRSLIFTTPSGAGITIQGSSVETTISQLTTSATSPTFAAVRPTSAATSGSGSAFAIIPTYNQASGTAANTDLLINRTETAVGSGAQLLADFQVGGTSKFSVSNVAAATLTHTSNPLLTVTDGTVSGFFTINTAGIKAQLGTNTNHQVEILQNGGSALLIGTSKQATFAGALITTPQALSGAGAVNVTTSATFYTSTGGAQALTLADGTSEGQIKTIVHKVDGGSGVLTPTTKIGFTTITFTNVGDSCTLQWTSAGWAIVGIFGAVAA